MAERRPCTNRARFASALDDEVLHMRHAIQRASLISQLDNLLQQLQDTEGKLHWWEEEHDRMAAQLSEEKDKVLKKDQKLLEYESIIQNNQQQVDELKKQLCQRDTEVLQLKKEKESLSASLAHTETQVAIKEKEKVLHEKTWQTKYNCLQEKSRKELAEKDASWEMSVKQVEEEKKKLQQKNTKLVDEKNDLEKTLSESKSQIYHLTQHLKLKKEREVKESLWKEELCQKDCEILQLKKEKEGLSESLTQTTSQLLIKEAEKVSSEKTWQINYSCLQEKMEKQLKEKDLSWQMTVKQVEDEKKTLEEVNEKLVDEKTILEKEKTKLEELKMEVEHENKKLVEEKTKLQGENKELEERCLQMQQQKKKKKRFWFFLKKKKENTMTTTGEK